MPINKHGGMSKSQQWQQVSSIWFLLLKSLLLMTTGGFVVVVLFVGLGIWRMGEDFKGQLVGIFNPPPSTPQVDVRSLVVHQVRPVSELTTATLAMEAVVPTRQATTLGGYVIGTTKLLYIAYGEVRAGVNLENLQLTDVQIVNNTMLLRLPPPQILDSKIDVTRSSVYDYDRGFLDLGPDVAPQLQTQAQQEALKKIVATACRSGLLQEANKRAELVVTQLLNTAGYKVVEVVSTPPSEGTCIKQTFNSQNHLFVK